MRRIRSTRLALLGAVAVLAALLGAVGVGSAAENITADPECCTFSKPEFHSNEGERPVFAGNGIDFHNVTAKGRGPDGGRLFRSADIKGGTSPVEGAQYLTAGDYLFECTLHLGMEATLVVGPGGTPAPRPVVRAAVLRQTLKRVLATGKLKVRLRSPTGAKDVDIVARGAGAVLARGNNVDIGRGAGRVVRLKLTHAGRSALAKRRSAKVSLTLKIPFGSPATASRTLGGG
jgi:plastocyanin